MMAIPPMDQLVQEDLRRQLGLAIQILEELPDKFRPESNIVDMREILAGGWDGPDARVTVLLVQAVATALAFRTLTVLNAPTRRASRNEPYMGGLENRIAEFQTLFELVKLADAGVLASYYAAACSGLAATQPEPHDSTQP
jgi:hypothetical protein